MISTKKIKNKKNYEPLLMAAMVFTAFLFFASCAIAQDSATGYSSPVHYEDMFQHAKNSFAFGGKSKPDFDRWHATFLFQLKHVLGLDLMEQEMNGYVVRAEKKAGYDSAHFSIQHWVIWTEPTVPLPIVVLIPKNKTGRLPLVIATHGHGRDSALYDGNYPKIAGIATAAIDAGYIAIEPTMRAFGSTRTEADKKEGNSFSCHTQLMKDLLVGRTVIGDRVWDMSRILDWAIQNLPVDTNKIAITGNSGGGTASLFAAACDARIKVAVPSSAFCTFTGSIGAMSHCDCNYIPGILNLGEMGDVAGLIAPRPLCAVNGTEDPIFPIAETRKSFKHLEEIYAAAGSSGNVALYEGNGGHKYYPEGAWPFIKKYFDTDNAKKKSPGK